MRTDAVVFSRYESLRKRCGAGGNLIHIDASADAAVIYIVCRADRQPAVRQADFRSKQHAFFGCVVLRVNSLNLCPGSVFSVESKQRNRPARDLLVGSVRRANGKEIPLQGQGLTESRCCVF